MAIIGYPACKDALEALLSQIATRMNALPAGDEDALSVAVGDALEQLGEFESASLANNMSDAAEVAAITKLDAFSKRTRDELVLRALTEIVGMMDIRAAELRQLTATLDKQTATNVSSAQGIRLVPIRNAIMSATATVESLKTLGKSLKQSDPDEAKIFANINALIAQFGELRTAMNNAGVNV